ncbi:hypothetical protein [Hymenobacter psychrophilus]|uniref:Lipocalin-like domain-containing protein n=1 Tax=Hymenobacter psychrophilus TaxID=651662 RepID=A0A1H3FGT2_9BACT|nr:hypothetical protein [Hymenobacter psychrophilus]SDX90065.1 hypothetical protein SAMN04488069_10464 [Hymenobacter psychrophilus]
MRLFTLFAALSVLLLAATCRPESQDSRLPPNLKQLEGTWLHAHEEDQADVLVYRPNTYAFPPSRGRTGFAFERNGLFTQYDIAPTDGLEGHKGRWKVQKDNTLLIDLDDQPDSGYALEIVSLENNVLKVRRKDL